MARGQVSPVAPPLPKVSFQKIEDDVSTQPSGVHDGQARSFGYNDFSEFHRPDQYIRHIEPLEIDLERQVEYDMDEQDQEWLDAVNAERKKEQLDKVSHEVFEVIMDRLEKEWFNLTKHIPKPDLALPSEDSTCAICDDSEGENSNAIVFCDGCNLAVHQDCYGVPYIPEGQWLCRKCTVSPENPVSCILCPNEGGAFKQTTQGEWIHLLCAIWVPETRVSNDVFMEPIIGVERISKQRWKLKCAICETREGACIQCAKQSCFLAFHVTCARKDKLLLPMKSAQGSEPGALTCYCDRHLPKEQAEIREAAQKAEEEEDEEQYNSAKLSKSARAYAKTYKPGPPLVPAIIIDRILQYISRTNIRKKPEFIAMMCKYWSLKREARRGAPLLKRLHLEPWTASTSAKMQGEEEKVMKLEQLQHLRKDLEDLKGLTELSRKRESRKLRQAELIHDILSQALFVHVPKLRAAFERIVSVDRQDYFKNPVSKKDVPDYFDIVQNPMSWSNIESKLDNYQYWDIQSFKNDIHLVLNNAVLYNKEGTAFHRTALRILATAQPVLADLNQLSSLPSLRSTDPNQVDGAAPSWAPPLIGDLEPPLEILELLISSDAIQDESDLFLSADPITSLFNFELERKKPLPPSPTPPPDPEEIREKNRQARALNKEKRQKEKEASSSASAARRRPKGSKVSAPASAPVSMSVSGSSKGPRQRRSSAQIPTPGDIPLVEHVDQKDSFTMFEKGWILPVGTRRGGRVPLDRPILPPPKKKMRMDRGSTSRLSVFSTAASENQTLQDGSPREGSAYDLDDSMDVDSGERPNSHRNAANRSLDSIPPRLHSLPGVTPERVTIPPPNVIRTPDGKVIIEELDTPAIRKEKKRQKKQLAAEAAAAAAADATTSQFEIDDGEPLSPISASDDEPPDPNEYSDADAEASSDLSEMDSEGEQEEPDKGRLVGVDGEHVLPADEQPIFDGEQDVADNEDSERDGEHAGAGLPHVAAGTETTGAGNLGSVLSVFRGSENLTTLLTVYLVWAKAVSYPWWPAIVFHDTDSMIPTKVLAEAQSQRRRRKGKGTLYIVRFFDKTKSW
ncbi:bromodomain and PHD finger-containing protein 3 [Mycena crocata]|nr:bromodomain and PHD finger-containing protein 3 [Mycena crocata]